MNTNSSKELFPNRGFDSEFKRSASSVDSLSARHDQTSSDFLVYYRAIMRWKWLILFISVACAAGVWQLTKMQPARYTSISRLLLNVDEVKTVSIQEIFDPTASKSVAFVNTQLEMLKSPEVLDRVIEELALDTSPAFDPRQARPDLIGSLILQVKGETFVPPSYTDEQVRAIVAKRLSKGIDAKLLAQSFLVEIRYTSTDAQLSAAIANSLANALVVNDLENKFAMTQKATDWMNARVDELKDQLAQSEARLQKFRDSRGIVDTQGVVATATAQLSGTTSQLIAARAERTRLESAYQRVQMLLDTKGNLLDEPMVARAPMVIETRNQMSIAQRAFSQVQERYGPQHPSFKKADAELKAASSSYEREIQLAAAQIQKDYESADATVAAIDQTVRSAKQQVATVNRNEFQLAALQRDVENNRQLYNLFVGRLKETNATDGFKRTIGRNVDPAVMGVKTFPNPLGYSAIAFVLVLLSSAGIAVVVELFDSTIRSSDDVELRLGAPILATIPLLGGFSREMKTVNSEPNSVFAEAFRTIKTGIVLSEVGAQHVVVAVTSSVPGEGKSTVSANLAMVHAQSKKTLLIEADMRRPTLHRLMGAKSGRDKQRGLSDLISGQANLQEVVQSVPGSDLDFIGAGTPAPNPLDLLSSSQFAKLLENLREQYSMIIIDTPPIRLVSDALIVGNRCNGIVYVVQSKDTPAKLALKGVSEIRRTGSRLIGVVLNKHDLKKADRYYGENSGYSKVGYGSYYGADRVKKAKTKNEPRSAKVAGRDKGDARSEPDLKSNHSA